MGKIRGFLLKNRVTMIFRRVYRHRRSPAAYLLLNPPQNFLSKPFSTLMSWTHSLRTKAKAIASKNREPGRGYVRVGQDPVLGKPDPVPKGHLAVYVGQKDGDLKRIMVPIVYFNHPLFGDLLRESEKEYGFNHPGGITIPCRVSEFERVQTRIKTVHCGTRKLLTWKRSSRSYECFSA